MPKRYGRAVDQNVATAVEIFDNDSRHANLLSQANRNVRETIDNEWLGLGDTTLIPTENPFSKRELADIENPVRFVLSLMRKPEYFSWTAKHILNRTITPMQACWLWQLWHKPFPMLLGSRGAAKSFTLALYIMLRMLFCQGSKIIVVGAGFRQAKVIFDYCEHIWQSAPLLADIVGRGGQNGARHEADCNSLRMGESIIKAIPLGDGTKIRGQRASIVIADEYAAIDEEIFQNVVSGFAAVSLSPIEKLQAVGRRRAMKRMNIEAGEEAPVVPGMNSNQTIISGTAYYRFNHFFKEYSKYKSFIESRGDPKKVAELFAGEVPEKFNWRDYCIIRIPVDMLPEGFMDERHVAKARVTLHRSQFSMEYKACFPKDSDGFFKRSLIESRVAGKPDNPIELPSCGVIDFSAVLRGERDRIHVMGIDPASESDNFAIVILEVWPDHRRVVYCWTTTRKRHKARLSRNLAKEHDYYNYVGRKIRELMQQFRIAHIAMDKQGGGVAVLENLTDPERCKEGEIPILPVIVKDDEQRTDHLAGDHILELCSFAKADWVSGANHGMKKDLESGVLFFPAFNSATIGLAMEEDRAMGRIQTNEEGEEERLYDTLEDCALDIEELKEELASIVHTQVGTSRRDHWDTPVGQSQLGKKVRTRKDRYSALLMANMAARTIAMTPARPEYLITGGFADGLRYAAPQQPKSRHQNPYWYDQAVNSPDYGAVVRHK